MIVTQLEYAIMPAIKEIRMADNRDKRQSQRISFSQPIELETVGQENVEGCLGCDLSDSGARINLSDFVPIGKEYVVRTRLENGQVIECMAKVVWVSKMPHSERYQAGLHFLQPEQLVDTKRRIQSYIYK